MSRVLDLIRTLAGNPATDEATATLTPPQFDADAQVATTEFVQRALGNSRGYLGVTTNTALTAAHCGRDIYASTTTGSITLTLPSAAALPAGAKFKIANTGVDNVIVSRVGSDTVVLGTTNNTVTSITLKAGDWIELSSLGTGTLWYHSGGTAQLGFSSAFAATLGASWSQTLPSGIILKGGTGSITTNTTILFPEAFPNAIYTCSMTPGPNPTPGNFTIDMSGSSVAGFIGSAYVAATGAAATRVVTYFAVGR